MNVEWALTEKSVFVQLRDIGGGGAREQGGGAGKARSEEREVKKRAHLATGSLTTIILQTI